MKNLISPLSVGILTLIALGFLVWSVLKVKKGLPPGVGRYNIHALFDDASGLGPRTRVVLAGVNVGQIEDVQLVGHRAKVTLSIRTDAVLKQDASIAKRQFSVLGDYYLELLPGLVDPPLGDGAEVKNVLTALGVDGLLRQLGGITKTIDLVAKDVQKVTRQVAGVFGTDTGQKKLQEIVDRVAQIARQVNEAVLGTTQRLNYVLGNFGKFSARLNTFTGDTATRVGDILKTVGAVASDVRGIVDRSGGSLKTNFEQVRTTLEGVKAAVDSVNRSLGSIESITRRVEKGEGLAGQLTSKSSEGIVPKAEKLVERTSDVVENIGETFEGVGNVLEPLIRLQPVLDLRAEVFGSTGKFKSYVGLRLETRPDKFYMIELINDPKGRTTFERRVTRSTSSRTDPVVSEETTLTEDKLKFTFMLAKRFGPSIWRFGIKESTGGVGLDFVMPANLEVNLDLFDFIGDDRPRLKSFLMWHFYSPFYLAAGVDDIFNGASRDFFVGLGLRFTDEDLKSLLLVAPRGP